MKGMTKEEYLSRFSEDARVMASKYWDHYIKATKGKDTSIIPKGSYCYSFLSERTKWGMPKTKYCPYRKCKQYGEVFVDYCEYLELGDYGGVTGEDRDKLVSFFGNEEKLNEELKIMLLWDDCKECGENEDYK